MPHRVPWHWQVPAYLVTKAIGAGAFIVAAAGVALGLLPSIPLFTTIASFLALLFVGVTVGLLVWDLDRPERFWTILIRPQWRSWLTRGAVILIAFTVVVGLLVGSPAVGFGRAGRAPAMARSPARHPLGGLHRISLRAGRRA